MWPRVHSENTEMVDYLQSNNDAEDDALHEGLRDRAYYNSLISHKQLQQEMNESGIYNLAYRPVSLCLLAYILPCMTFTLHASIPTGTARPQQVYLCRVSLSKY